MSWGFLSLIIKIVLASVILAGGVKLLLDGRSVGILVCAAGLATMLAAYKFYVEMRELRR